MTVYARSGYVTAYNYSPAIPLDPGLVHRLLTSGYSQWIVFQFEDQITIMDDIEFSMSPTLAPTVYPNGESTSERWTNDDIGKKFRRIPDGASRLLGNA